MLLTNTDGSLFLTFGAYKITAVSNFTERTCGLREMTTDTAGQ